jgi:hypothetical protein
VLNHKILYFTSAEIHTHTHTIRVFFVDILQNIKEVCARKGPEEIEQRKKN